VLLFHAFLSPLLLIGDACDSAHDARTSITQTACRLQELAVVTQQTPSTLSRRAQFLDRHLKSTTRDSRGLLASSGSSSDWLAPPAYGESSSQQAGIHKIPVDQRIATTAASVTLLVELTDGQNADPNCIPREYSPPGR
jgi:hypothetical protein